MSATGKGNYEAITGSIDDIARPGGNSLPGGSERHAADGRRGASRDAGRRGGAGWDATGRCAAIRPGAAVPVAGAIDHHTCAAAHTYVGADCHLDASPDRCAAGHPYPGAQRNPQAETQAYPTSSTC